MGKNYCVVCEQEMQIGYTEWHFRCSTCKYESSNLRSTINQSPSLNYDEGLSVISPLKKLNTGKGVRAYMSPQAFKYSLYITCQELFNWRLSEVKQIGQGEKKTTQCGIQC